MPVLLSCQSLTKSYGSRPLFREISIGLDERERVGLIGPNGAGKSTLLKILGGIDRPDSGVVSLQRGTKAGYVAQQDLLPDGMTVEQALWNALEALPEDETVKSVRVNSLLGRAGFTGPGQSVEALSGGWRKRLAIARELIREPDILLLDEPTNHLDVEGILWLENLLRTAPFASLIVSHDRTFLERVAGRMIELNRAYPDGYFSARGAYSDFLEKREEFLQAQAHQELALSNRVRREIEWLRRGAQGRTTKQQARTKQANQMIGELSDLRERNNQNRTAGIDFSATARRTKELLSAGNLRASRGGRTLFEKLSFILSPGVRLGLLGPNGCGKTTLLKMLAGEISPDAGEVRRAEGLRTVFFDQNREQLDPDVSLKVALAGERDSVEYRGSTVHVSSWAKRFLFPPEQLSLPVSELSGGEQARVLIARLMLQPADLLIMDEPTNDLDIPTLEVLEESLAEFPGALVLVTHDRYMLDRVSTTILALDGLGSAAFYADLAQWEATGMMPRQAPQPISQKPGQTASLRHPSTSNGLQTEMATSPTRNPARGLTAREQKELDRMQARIEEAEKDLQRRTEELTDPVVSADHVKLRQLSEALQEAQDRVEALFERWQDLEARREA